MLLFGQIGQRVDDRCLERRIDRAIGVIPQAEVAHADANLTLFVQPEERALFTLAAQLERIDVVKILDTEMLERLDALLHEGEVRLDLIRDAIEKELKRRERRERA